MKRMCRVLAAASVFLALSVRLSVADEREFVGIDFHNKKSNKHYVVTVTDERLKSTPSWEKRPENPPLSARRALKLANDFKNTFVKDAPGWKWEFQSIGLKHNGPANAPQKWYWVAYYEEYPLHGFLGGAPPYLFVVVLMDGTVLKPAVKISSDD
jgi:hypothetical protein